MSGKLEFHVTLIRLLLSEVRWERATRLRAAGIHVAALLVARILGSTVRALACWRVHSPASNHHTLRTAYWN